MKTIGVVAAVLAGSVILPSAASGVAVDGHLDPDYGAPRCTQSNLTNFGDTPSDYAPYDSVNTAIGSELDGAYGVIIEGTLHLFFSGNLRSYVGEPLTSPDQLEVFIDCAAGGQNVLRADNPDLGWYVRLPQLAGLKFDTGFAADYWLDFTAGGSGQPASAFLAALPATGDGAGALLGSAQGGPPGILAGGTNPFGILATIDQTNRAGVTAGCGAASSSDAASGIELAIPLAAIGNPTGLIKVCAFIDGRGGVVSNQVLAPLPSSTCALGSPGGVNLGAIAGPQFFLIDAATAARPVTWGRVRVMYR